MLTGAGGIIFDNLPIIFALGVAIGLAGGDGVCYNKFYNITLPSYLGFFAGKRFVPIMMATTSFILAFPMAIIWPTIQNGLNAFSEGLLDSNTGLAVFLFDLLSDY